MMIKKVALYLVISIFAVAALASNVEYADAAQSIENEQVRICHATSSSANSNNPYTNNTVSINAVGANGLGGHYDNHKGEVGLVIYNNAIHQIAKDDNRVWGDIIPPTAVYPSGLNWTAQGQAVWSNGCDYTKVATASVSTIAASCDLAERLVYGAITNATFSGTANGTYGPGTYTVMATANSDALFYNVIPPVTTRVFSGTLSDKIPVQSTNPEAPCYIAPELSMAIAEISVIPATCERGERLVYGAITNATFSGTANGTYGPGSYEVTATADEGAEFEGGKALKEFTGTLADRLPITDEQCLPGRGGGDFVTPQTPASAQSTAAPQIERLPYTSGTSTAAAVLGSSLVAGTMLAAAYVLRIRAAMQL